MGTFSVFSYQCNQLNWTCHYANIGFSASSTFYANHPLAQNTSVNSIACLNQPASIWSNVVYHVTESKLLLCIILKC